VFADHADPPKLQLLSTVRRSDYGCLVAERKRWRGVLMSRPVGSALDPAKSLRWASRHE
jgi:hypothetical protein